MALELGLITRVRLNDVGLTSRFRSGKISLVLKIMSKIFSRFGAFLPTCGVVLTLVGSLTPANANIPWGGNKTDPPNSQMMRVTTFSTSSYISSLAWSPDGETLAVGENGSIVFYSASGQVLKTYSVLPRALHPDAAPDKQDDQLGIETEGIYAVTGLWWSPDSKSLAARVDEAGIPVWNTESDQIKFILGDHKKGTLCLAWSPKNDTIATGGGDTLINLFDASTGTLTKTLDSHLFPVRQLAFGKTEDEIVSLGIRSQSGPQNTEIKHWSIATGRPTSEIMQDYGCYFSALSPEGGCLFFIPLWYRCSNSTNSSLQYNHWTNYSYPL